MVKNIIYFEWVVLFGFLIKKSDSLRFISNIEFLIMFSRSQRNFLNCNIIYQFTPNLAASKDVQREITHKIIVEEVSLNYLTAATFAIRIYLLFTIY